MSDWFQANKRNLWCLNQDKKILFGYSIKVLTLNNGNVEQVKEAVFWGVILDENFSWKSHISHTANKISISIGVIFKASFYLPLVSLRILYYSMTYPYLQYCNTVWGSTYPTNLYRIILLQKRIIIL